MRFTRFPVALLAVAAVAGACSTDLTGLNKNPNSPTTAPATALFTNATATTVGRFWGSFQTLSMTELFVNHIAQVQYVDEDRGRVRPNVIDGLFTAIYSAELEDYQKVIDQGVAAKAPNISGPAQVMQSWVYLQATDWWGDIPYSEALKGDAGGSLTPKYDAQKDIYYGILKTLTDASAAMGGSGSGLAGADPIYKGDVAKWKKFSNSLRARMALRMLKADPAKAGTELSAAFSAGVFTSNADNASMAWPGDGVFDAPWASNFATRDDHRVGKLLVDTLLALNDPRLKIYAQPTKADPTKYTGLQNGLDNILVAPFFNTTSRPGAIYYPGATSYGTYGTAAGKRTPSNLMTYSEVEFLAAEAAERGLGGQSGAAAHYNNAVRASITQWGGTDAEATAYLAQPSVAYVSGAEGLKRIGVQKWISLFTQGNEAWAEWRRTGNPSTIVPGPKQYWNYVNRRLPYSSNEASVNKVNLTAAIARQGPDDYSTRMWWDK